MKLSEIKMIEAAYPGNLGMVEMFKFYEVASATEKSEMKSLLGAKRMKEAWKLLQRVVGAQLNDA